MFTFALDRGAKAPLYEQLYKFIRGEIESGRLNPGEKLPSKRNLAAHLKISVFTVETAYGQLMAEGYLSAVPKRGYFVESLLSLPQRAPGIPAALSEKIRKPYLFDLKTNAVATELFPFSTWAKLGREVLSRGGDALLNETHPQGAYELRRAIAAYLRAYRGIEADPAQIVVGAGSETMIGLLSQMLGREKRYAVEDPGYGKIYHALLRNGAAPIPIPLDEEGLSIDEVRRQNADILHVTPSHQFPAGTVMPIRRRLALLHWAAESPGHYIIEDDYDSEFRFTGQPIPAMQGMDTEEKVIYLNAFTKSLAPSLRINYMVLPLHLLERYRREFPFHACAVPNFEQYTLALFMAEDHFERHLRRMRGVYKERRDAFVAAISQSPLGKSLRLIGHEAGLHLLLEFEQDREEKQLVDAAKVVGVRVYGLSEYCRGEARPERATIVIGYSGLSPENITAAAERLLEAWV